MHIKTTLQQYVKSIFSLQYFVIWSLLLLSSGCSQFNGTRLENYLGGEENLIRLSYSIADTLEKRAFPPLIALHPEQPVLITTFVNNEDLKETSKFSRILQENIASRFVQHGYTVREIKLEEKLHIKPHSGETILSRESSQIKPQQNAQAIVTGTFTLSERNIYISARLVNPHSGNIISTTDHKIVMDKNILAMFGLMLTPTDDIDFIEEPKTPLMTRLLY